MPPKHLLVLRWTAKDTPSNREFAQAELDHVAQFYENENDTGVLRALLADRGMTRVGLHVLPATPDGKPIGIGGIPP